MPNPPHLGRSADGSILRQLVLDNKGYIAEDVACEECGYNLRGLRLKSRCPECNGTLPASLRADLLEYADPVWVQRLCCGMKWILVGLGLALLTKPAIGLLLMAPALVQSTGPGGMLTIAVTGALVLAFVLAPIPLAYGVWLLISPEPAVPLRCSWLVRFTRFAVVVAIEVGMVVLRGSPLDLTIDCVVGAPFVASVVFVLARMGYLGSRLPGARIEVESQMVIVGVVLAGVGIPLLTATGLVTEFSQWPAWFCTPLLLWIVLIIERLRRGLKRAAEEAVEYARQLSESQNAAAG